MEHLWLITRIVLGVATVLGIFFFFNLKQEYKWITLYLVLSLITDRLNTYFELNTSYNLFIIPIFSLFEFGIFCKIYSLYLSQKQWWWKAMVVLTPLLIILDILFLCDLFNVTTFYAFSKVITDISIVIFGLSCYEEMIKENRAYSKELFFMNTAFTGYYLANAVIFLSINFLVNASLSIVTPFWVFHVLITLFLYTFLIIMIWRHGRIRKTLPYG